MPGAPKSKERPRRDPRTNHTYTPQATLDAEEMVRWCYRASTKVLHATLAQTKIDFDFALEVDAYLPDGRTKDWDNIGKLISDALNGIAYKDDKQVKDGHVRLFVDKNNPRTDVRLYILE